MNGPGSPGGWYDKPVYGMRSQALSNNIGIELHVGEDLKAPNASIGYWVNKWYKMSQDEISRDYGVWNPLHIHVYKNSPSSSMGIQSLPLEYPNVGGDFGNQLESGLTQLYDVYTRIKDFEINP